MLNRTPARGQRTSAGGLTPRRRGVEQERPSAGVRYAGWGHAYLR